MQELVHEIILKYIYFLLLKPKYFKAVHRANAYVNAVGHNGDPGYKKPSLFGAGAGTILKWMAWLWFAYFILGFIARCGGP